jgi:HEAT repeat protein
LDGNPTEGSKRTPMLPDAIQHILDRLSTPIPDDENIDAETEARGEIQDQLVELGRQDERVVLRIIPILADKRRTGRYQFASVLLRIGPGAKAAIPALLRILEDKGEQDSIRSMARNALGYMGPDVVPVLGRRLKDSDDAYVRRAIAGALGRTAEFGQSGIPVLVASFLDKDAGVRSNAVESLAAFGARAVPALRDSLRHESMAVRACSAEVLIKADPECAPIVVPALIEASKQPDVAARIHAAKAWSKLAERGTDLAAVVGELMTRRAVASLADLLNDPEEDVSHNVAYGLGGIGPAAEPAVPALINALSDQSEFVRGYAARTLGSIGPVARPAVMSLVKAAKDESDGVREFTLSALAQIGPEARSALPSLEEMLKEKELDDALRAEVNSVIKSIKAKGGVRKRLP